MRSTWIPQDSARLCFLAAIRERARLAKSAAGVRFPIVAIAARRGCNYTRERRILRSAAVVAYEY